ncbi:MULTISPECIES: sugar-binding transcriptional regulator [Microbacterium]|jgi:deoxyribonucleoside regulator|uniref:Deoxyribonucleoside regulator n=2 Tax=Microbacterium ginsengisoli TaxID=400772 RepID=A0A0F0LTR1_9MICO|nr:MULTISPECIES: sugar-binding domain-containing protein [Microbacterium]KJL36508.1 Deoxyribonucleoside regulator [Microbacterium ginsengisoli]MCK9917317.1 sugar-binding transcriptional regulator [Microbacteriaceae bacterium K1510]
MSEDANATRSRDALRAAQLYYLQDRNMDAIANEMKISRSSISRLLAYARESGLVEITVHSPQEAASHLTQRLGERYGVTVHVVPTRPRVTEAERLERTAMSAARILAMMADSNMVIGAAWGATLSAIARNLPRKALHNSHVVQMNGAANVETSGIGYAGEILDRFGRAFDARVHYFPVPALFDDPMTKQAMWRERSVRSVLDVQARVGLFVFGLGSPKADVPSHVYAGGYFTADDMHTLARYDVVGDCATVFYRGDGTPDGIPLNGRSSGPDFEAVKRIPHRLCVVSSESKLDALRGALRAGIITDLVVEETVARRLSATVDAP